MNDSASRSLPPKLILAVCCIGTMALAMVMQILPAMLASVGGEFILNLEQRGLLLMIAPVGFVASTLVSGLLAGRYGQRLFIVLGFILTAAGTALAAVSSNYLLFQAGMLMVGVSTGFLESPLSAAAARAYPEQRGEIVNLVQMFFTVGAVTGPALVGGILALDWTWRAGFAMCAVISGIMVIFTFRGLPDSPENTEHSDSGSIEPINWGIVTIASGLLAIYVGAEMTVAQWSSNYLERTLHAPPARAALVVSGFWLCMMIGRALYVGIVRRAGYLPPVAASGLLAAISSLLASHAQSAKAGFLWCSLTGLFLAGTWPTLVAYAGSRNPKRIGAVFGIVVSVGAVGLLLVPPFAGWLAQRSARELRVAFDLSAGLLLTLSVLTTILWAWDRRH